jgi:hypothetical protein
MATEAQIAANRLNLGLRVLTDTGKARHGEIKQL